MITMRHLMNAGFLAAALAFIAPAMAADDVMDARHVLDESAIAVERVREGTKRGQEMDNNLSNAKGVLVIPSYYKASFILGGAYGDGALLKRLPDGSFGDPAFYRMTSGSIGLQAGMQSSEIVFLILTEKGLEAVMNDEFKIGANVGISVGTVGAGAEAATTTNVGNDIVAYSVNSGLFAGGSFEGAVIKPRKDWNAAVYGVDNDDPRAVVNRNQLRAAERLKDVLGKGIYPTAPQMQ
jgi:lipid-binding SYLF domain-containing protein